MRTATQDFTRRQLADGMAWADQSCRIGGTLALALRKATTAQVEGILDRMERDGLTTMGEVPRWLNSHSHELVGA